MAHYRTRKQPTGRESFYKNVVPVVISVGASVVILGALFKLMHWPYSSTFLIIGLGTESLIFLVTAFQPPPDEPDWSILYPELAADEGGKKSKSKEVTKKDATKKMDDMLADAEINEDVLQKLGQNFKQLNDTVGKMGEISDAASASNEYASSVRQATSSIQELNKSYSETVSAMSEMANASTDAKEYHAQVQNITKNLSALNAVYEMELQDANSHLKAMNKFYGNLSSAMENMAEASKDTETFKSELTSLTSNLSSLNSVYGNMLNAMRQ